MGNEGPLTTGTPAPVALAVTDAHACPAPASASAVRPAGHRRAHRRLGPGFVPRNETLHRIYNLAVVIPITIVALPVMALISLALLFTQGPGILHFGERLGRDGRRFNMIKFRTLDTEAQRLSRTGALPKDSGLETPLGKFLRASRLDELPQLFNILLGDMNIYGPRPVRPVLAEAEMRRNPLYGMRFHVKPGLIGHTQAYMPHDATRRLRAKYNYILCTNPVYYRMELALCLQVGMRVLSRALVEIWLHLRPRKDHHAAAQEARRARRWQLGLRLDTSKTEIPVIGISHDRIILAERLSQPMPGRVDLIIRVRPTGTRKALISLTEIGPVKDGYAYAYAPGNEVAIYMIDRYPMSEPAIPPRPPKPVSAPFRQADRQGPMTGAKGISAK